MVTQEMDPYCLEVKKVWSVNSSARIVVMNVNKLVVFCNWVTDHVIALSQQSCSEFPTDFPQFDWDLPVWHFPPNYMVFCYCLAGYFIVPPIVVFSMQDISGRVYMLFNREFKSIFGTFVIHCCTESRNHFHSSNREGCGHALVSLNIRSLDGQLSIETATHS